MIATVTASARSILSAPASAPAARSKGIAGIGNPNCSTNTHENSRA